MSDIRCAGVVLLLIFLPWKAWGLPFPGISPQTIYGEDNRQELYEVDDPWIQELARSTVALVKDRDILLDEKKDRLTLSGTVYDDRFFYPICRQEPFYGQRTAAFCSGSLVGEDLVLTAGHCIQHIGECKKTWFVFDFKLSGPKDDPSNLPLENAYGCKRIVAQEFETDGADFALIQLDRKVADRTPLKLNRTGRIKRGEELMVIGHPAGLPTKFASDGWVRSRGTSTHFVAAVDTLMGNSGSPVLNASNGQIEGILARGDDDYVRGPGKFCYVSYRCPEEGCKGEDVIYAAIAAPHIPE